MKCEEVEIRMVDYLDNHLEEDISRDIEKHVETCERCSTELARTKEIFDMISSDEMSRPDESLRNGFYRMLDDQIAESKQSFSVREKSPWYSIAGYRAAAAIALLVCGTFAGVFLGSSLRDSSSSGAIAQLQAEVTELKKTAIYTLPEISSSSERLRAVSYAGELDTPDENVIEAILYTLNSDSNVNVRMAAAYALAKFAYRPEVCDSLVSSLRIQTDPLLQITLINILAEHEVKSAFRPVQEIITNKNTLKEVRIAAENNLRAFI